MSQLSPPADSELQAVTLSEGVLDEDEIDGNAAAGHACAVLDTWQSSEAGVFCHYIEGLLSQVRIV